MSSLHAWLLAARPKTLTAGIVPVVAATALAVHDGVAIELWIPLFALMCAVLIQTGTNFVNDAWDFKKGTDTAERLGPKRVTQSGLLMPDVVLKGAAIVLFLALLLGVPLVIHGGIPILIIGLFSILFAWGYTAGPFPLAYLGLGELFVLIFFGLIAVCGTYLLYTGTCSRESVLLGTQIGLFSVLIIAINNLRDIEGDTRSNKKTLAVRLGDRGARRAIFLFSIAPFLIGLEWLTVSTNCALLPLLLLPLALKIAIPLQTLPQGTIYNSFLGKSALLHALFGTVISLALLMH